MRILHIYKSFNYGGAQKYLKDCINYFNNENKVDALVINDKKNIIHYTNNTKVIELPKLFSFDSADVSIQFPWYLLKLRSAYDIYHFHFPNPIGELSWLLSRKGKIKTVTTYHNDVATEKKFSKFYNTMMRSYLNKMDKIIVTSENVANTSELLKGFKEKIEVIPLGIDMEMISNVSHVETVSNCNLKILFVGRLAKVKGVEYLIRAIKMTNAELSIVGDGPLKEELKMIIHEEKLEEQIRLLGYVDDERLTRLYEEADVFVLPSIYRGEGFGYVLLEAMKNFTACISTELGTGTSFANKNNVTGFVVPPKDSFAIAEMINILDQDRSLLEKFKKNGFDRVQKEFDLRIMCNRVGEVYDDLLK